MQHYFSNFAAHLAQPSLAGVQGIYRIIMFAFALYDVAGKTLFMTCGPMGKEPLHYSLLPDGAFIFGLELKSLLPYPGLARAIDPLAIEEQLQWTTRAPGHLDRATREGH